jgi:HlyD family secretion protein
VKKNSKKVGLLPCKITRGGGCTGTVEKDVWKTMKIRFLLCITLLIAIAILASGCQSITGHPGATSTPLPVVTQEPGVLAEGTLVPRKYVNLSFTSGGMIEEILVEEGQQIEGGQVIAHLDQRQQLSAAVDNAQLELINAQQALKDLNDNAAVTTANAQLKVTVQRDAVREAERHLTNLQTSAEQTDIDKARSNLVILKDRLDQAEKDFAPYQNKPETNLVRAQLLSKLADARDHYDDAVRLLNNLEGTTSEIDIAIANANLSLAQASLKLAEDEYEKVKDGIDPDLLESAQARVKAAETALEAARANLTSRELTAPFSGTVARLNLKEGEQVLPGQTALVLADFSGWLVETDDLTENEVTGIFTNQDASIAFDALPEQEFAGKVESISDLSTEKSGDVTYTTKVRLLDSDPRLRWGMTALVKFAVP